MNGSFLSTLFFADDSTWYLIYRLKIIFCIIIHSICYFSANVGFYLFLFFFWSLFSKRFLQNPRRKGRVDRTGKQADVRFEKVLSNRSETYQQQNLKKLVINIFKFVRKRIKLMICQTGSGNIARVILFIFLFYFLEFFDRATCTLYLPI